MKSSINLFRVSGIPIGLHWSVLVLGLFASYNLAVNFLPVASPGGTVGWYVLAALIGVVGLASSVLLHELGHALVAQRQGVSVKSINLWALGGAAQLGDQPPTPRAALRISAAGPAVSLMLALITGIPALMLGFLADASVSLPTTLLGYLGLVNLGLTLFNLIPALPLDGGRILQAILWQRGGDRHPATIRAASTGRFLGAAMVALGLGLMLTGNNGLWTVLIGFFIRSGAGAERRHATQAIRAREAQARAEAALRNSQRRPVLADFINVAWPNLDPTSSGPWGTTGPTPPPTGPTPRHPRVIEGTLVER